MTWFLQERDNSHSSLNIKNFTNSTNSKSKVLNILCSIAFLVDNNLAPAQ